MPSLPYPYQQSQGSSATLLLDLTKMGEELSKTDEAKQEAYARSRKLQTKLTQAKFLLETGATEAAGQENFAMDESLIKSLTEVIPDTSTRDGGREANLGARVEDYARFHSFCHFLETGNLLPPSACKYSTDEEYLGGACMGLCQDLSRYGMGRATARDPESVLVAKNLVQQILEYLMKFDFRNGPLRRKYDGCKYALRSLETLLYELSITGSAASGIESGGSDEPDKKRPRVAKEGEAGDNDETMGDADEAGKPESSWPEDELESIRERVAHRDELREALIKRCRDAQKNAKQAIYALHRGDAARADDLLKQCEACIKNDLMPTITEEPGLRYGSFANVLEEYAEGKLFYTWLLGKGVASDDLEGKKDFLSSPNGHLMQPDEFVADVVELTPEEYLGGLCDLTGEIGRYAVQRGTARDVDGVKRCLEANAAVHNAIQLMERYPGGINKKMDQLRRSVEKLQRMLYEMSLSEAAGGRRVETDEVNMEAEKED